MTKCEKCEDRGYLRNEKVGGMPDTRLVCTCAAGQEHQRILELVDRRDKSLDEITRLNDEIEEDEAEGKDVNTKVRELRTKIKALNAARDESGAVFHDEVEDFGMAYSDLGETLARDFLHEQEKDNPDYETTQLYRQLLKWGRSHNVDDEWGLPERRHKYRYDDYMGNVAYALVMRCFEPRFDSAEGKPDPEAAHNQRLLFSLFWWGIKRYAFPLLMNENLYRGVYELGIIDRDMYEERHLNDDTARPKFRVVKLEDHVKPEEPDEQG